MSSEAALRWVRRATVIAAVIAILDLAIWASHLFSDGVEVFRSVGLLDAAVTSLLALGLWRRSRAAACALVGYWMYSKVHQMVTTGYVVSPLLGLIVLGWVFVNAAIGTFILHRGQAAEADSATPAV